MENWDLRSFMRSSQNQKTHNFIFKNLGNLSFEDKSKEWGMSELTLSQGAAVADLDNDGDLDIVTNNFDEPATIYQNNADKRGSKYLRVKCNGSSKNKFGLGTKVTLYTNAGIQFQELQTTRGYQSSVEPILHFGLGNNTVIDKVEIKWADGKEEILKNISTNQVLAIEYSNAQDNVLEKQELKFLFALQNDAKISPKFVHKENKFDDYKKQVLLPHSQSQGGPFTTVGDVNGDGLEDFYVGGAQQQAGQLYLQKNSGNFVNKKVSVFENDKVHEDMGSLFFDADTDGDLDLYVTSGGAELEAKNPYYQDRLYLNDGRGNFSKSADALPQIFASTAVVVGSDYDKDGDVDLFVGGRIFPDHYPYSTQSYIFRNDGGKFTDVALQSGQNIALAGLVTSAVWTDIDTDGDDDLLVVGEWMPLKVIKNNGNAFVDATEEFGLSKTVGWWNKVVATDYDKDGDVDYIVGNLGLNHKFHASPEKPFHVYGSDFDKNGSVDVVLAKYDKDIQVPVRGRECSSEQMPFVAQKFPTFTQFADASISDILGEGMKQALHYEATIFESIILEKNGKWFCHKLFASCSPNRSH